MRPLVARFGIAHVAAYPIAFVVAIAAIAPVILSREAALLAAESNLEARTGFQRWLMSELALPASQAAMLELVLIPSGLIALGVFVLVHAAAVPWGLAAPERAARARRIWLWASLAPAAAIVLIGVGAWIWIAIGG
ncbi:MAG TPA: hypothetical protein VFB62_21260 [Polyangiaceae bacterium]|jgi:hypothetical protein|nr:hypothetical protein [Polyangiaceae bacterium]